MARKNRSIAAKADKARRQRIEAGAREGSKPLNQSHFTIGAANAKREAIQPLLAYTFNGSVVRCPTGKRPEPVGANTPRVDTRTFGNFKRRGSVLTADVYATDCPIVKFAGA